jgi:hypothetical protein
LFYFQINILLIQNKENLPGKAQRQSTNKTALTKAVIKETKNFTKADDSKSNDTEHWISNNSLKSTSFSEKASSTFTAYSQRLSESNELEKFKKILSSYPINLGWLKIFSFFF